MRNTCGLQEAHVSQEMASSRTRISGETTGADCLLLTSLSEEWNVDKNAFWWSNAFYLTTADQ